MSFSLGKLSHKWKSLKHNVLDKGSPSKWALKGAFGKKKGTEIGDSIDLAVGDAYTFGLTSAGAGAGKYVEAKWKQKKAQKAAKKAAKLEAKQYKLGMKQGLPPAPGNGMASIGLVKSPTGYRTSPGSGYVIGPKTDRNLALGSAGVELAQQFADDDSTWGRGLSTIGDALNQFGAPLGGGDDFGGGFGEPEPEAPASSGVSPLILVGVGVLALLALKG